MAKVKLAAHGGTLYSCVWIRWEISDRDSEVVMRRTLHCTRKFG